MTSRRKATAAALGSTYTRWSKQGHEELKNRVASLLGRGLRPPEIAQQISEPMLPDGQGGTRPNRSYMVNTRTGKPYAQRTIYRIIDELNAEWASESRESLSQWKAELLAQNAEVRRAAFAKGEHPTVLAGLDQLAKIIGAYKPTRFREEHRHVDLNTLTVEQMERLADGEDVESVLAGTGDIEARGDEDTG